MSGVQEGGRVSLLSVTRRKGKPRRPLLSCPALQPCFPSLLLPPTQQRGTQDRLLSLSFCKAPLNIGVAKGPFTEPFHFALTFLHTSIFFVSLWFHRDVYGIMNKAS